MPIEQLALAFDGVLELAPRRPGATVARCPKCGAELYDLVIDPLHGAGERVCCGRCETDFDWPEKEQEVRDA